MLANVRDLTTAVGQLQQKIDALYNSLDKVSGKATEALGGAQGVLQSGGQMGVGQGSATMSLGTDSAKFPTSQSASGGKMMPSSLGNFSFSWQFKQAPPETGLLGMGGDGDGDGGKKDTGLIYGPFDRAKDAFKGTLKIGLGAAAGAYAAMPDISLLGQRSVGLEQALRLGTGTRTMLNQQLTGGLRNAMSSVGSDAIVAPILASRGFMPGTADYKMLVGETAGAFRYLGVDNAAAASALASLRSAPTGASLYNLGINTYDAEKGQFKSAGQINRELMSTLTRGQKVTPQDIALSLQSGSLSGTLRDIYGGDEALIGMAQAQMMAIAEGKDPDLAVRGREEPIPILASVGKMNYAQTQLYETSEPKMLEGFAKAADVVEDFNKAMEGAVELLGFLKGFIGGAGGTNLGEAAVTGLPGILAGIKDLFKAAFSGLTGSGGGATGYGASFNANRLGGKGGGISAAPKGMVTAMYGAQDDGLWSASGGKHTGTDIAMPVGTPVEAAMDGTVSSTNAGADYGTSLILDHGNGYQTVYGHLSEKLVNLGDKVKQGQRIAKSGDTGNSTGPHLHYEVRFGQNNPVDPGALPSSMASISGSSLARDVGSPLEQLNNVLYNFMGKDIHPAEATAAGSSKLTSGSMGDKEQQKWAASLLSSLNAPASEANIRALNTWMKAEGRGFSTSLNRATYNPLNTTLDRPGAVSFNKVGVKAYTSWEQGLEATVSTLLGKSAADRGYSAIVNALQSDSGVSAVLGAVNNSAWRTGKTGGHGAYTAFSGKGGGSPTSLSGDAKTVNITVTFNQADDASAMRFAKQVQSYLDRENNNALMGSN